MSAAHHFFTTLSSMVHNPKIVGAWLVGLTLAIGTIGDKVYVDRTQELTIIQMELKYIREAVESIDATTKANQQDLIKLLVQQNKLMVELEAHEKATNGRSK